MSKSYNTSFSDPFATVHSTRLVAGEAVKLSAAAEEAMKIRQESKSIQDELKSIKVATSPFSELFFDEYVPTINETVVPERAEENIDFEDAFFDPPVKPLQEENQEEEFENDMNLDEPSSMKWTKSRITTQDKNISAFSEAKSSAGNERIHLTKEMLQTAQVIAQIEDKFIIIMSQGKLCVVDQHAADERVALEKLENALFNPDMHETMRVHLTKKQLLVGDILKATSVMPAKRVTLTKSQIEVVQQHREVLNRWHFSYKPPTAADESILLIGVPSVCGRETDAVDFVEFVDELNAAAGGHVKPKCVKRILASQACRYAVMFGDKLTHRQCEQLISNLSKCDFAFICAHGRPSVIPLVDSENDRPDSIRPTNVGQEAPIIQGKRTGRGSLRGPKRVIRPRFGW